MNAYAYILNKYAINPGKEHVVEIPNMGRNNLAELFAELNFNSGAEIGVGVGSYSEVLCQANPNLRLYSIDPWKISAYDPDVVPAKIAIHDSQEKFDEEYEEAKKRLAPYNCAIIRQDSLTTAHDFAVSSLDFVYIDANHNFVNVANDLHAWKKKVRAGGILSGHDFEDFHYKKQNHVKLAVQAYMQSYRMFPYFIVGAQTPKEGEIRDRVRSWMWVKSR